jgi:hypothetical protein
VEAFSEMFPVIKLSNAALFHLLSFLCLSVKSYASFLSFFGLSFLICKVEIIIPAS